MTQKLNRLSPTSLAQYIKLDNCDRFLRFRMNPEDEKRLLRRWNLTIQPLTPLLKEEGAAFEARVAEQIAGQGETVVNLDGTGPEETLRLLQNVREPTILLQASLEAPLGDYWLAGRADAIRLTRDRQGRLEVLIADIKASRQERTEHRLQVAVYAHMIQQLAAEQGLTVAGVQGAVLTLQEDGRIPALHADTLSFDLDTYLALLDRLVVQPDSTVRGILAQPFEDVFYHLSYRCDGCLYNALCMYDSAERLDLALTPQITATEKRVLLEAGVRTLPELAGLLDLPIGNGSKLAAAPSRQDMVAELNNRWPVGPNLPMLVQRARAALRNFDSQVDARPYLLGSGYGTLPSYEDHPDLIKVFFDAQHDYLRDRIYLLSALVSGQGGKRTVVELADAPPTHDGEGKLLRDWIYALLKAVQAVAAGQQAPIHLYCYNRYDQKMLLEALKRHLTEMAAIPAFFDLLTQTPALSQPIISFLFEEIQERLNLGLVCVPLHDAARRLGFDWRDERYEYYSLFRARMFDNRRNVLREPDGAIHRARADTPRDDPRQVTIESASRFNSQIPLEYAYAAWECIPEGKENSRLLEPFRGVTLEMLRAFSVRRSEALAHIEEKFRYKARYVQKESLHLPTLTQPEALPALDRSLIEFVYMEHHAALQAHLLTYNLPIDRRVGTGLALLLRYQDRDAAGSYCFVPEYASLGLDPELALNACKLKENDWVVLNPANPPLSPARVKHGRLAVIRQVSADEVVLELLRITFRNGDFRYFHNNRLEPQVGALYTVDPMADDLNADKVIEGLKYTENNAFFAWLTNTPPARPGVETTFFTRFADGVDALLRTRRRKLTPRQRDAITRHAEAHLVLVQGPPGTGKSYTLAWAILAHMAEAAVKGRPCRVAVVCKTHNAINVELRALAEAVQALGGFALPQLGGPALRGIEVYKVVNDVADPVPTGVQPLDAYKEQDVLETYFQKKLVVVGATSGGIYNLMKYRPLGGRGVDWSEKTFDLVVIDEASQMSLPEGVLACAFLKPEGKVLVVGDHRQMPPIIAHPWKDEQKRSVMQARPHVSLFESLLERNFPCIGLDESFRLHADIAEFLHLNIYSKDGIRFFSKRKELIPALPQLDPYVDAALDPAYPIVVIEHTERSSQQFNLLELNLTRPLIEACVRYLSLDGRDGIGVVVPHRAQKVLLRAAFPALAEVQSIDTVERFQGDERDVIIVSATASDPDYVRSEAEFLLNLNRLNVAISRPRKKLIVLASRSVIDLLTSDLDVFENSVIWKRLYYHYTPEVLHRNQLNGYQMSVRGRRTQ